VRAQGASEGKNFEEKPTPSKTNPLSFLGVNIMQLYFLFVLKKNFINTLLMIEK
jgi:hypothetical protein